MAKHFFHCALVSAIVASMLIGSSLAGAQEPIATTRAHDGDADGGHEPSPAPKSAANAEGQDAEFIPRQVLVGYERGVPALERANVRATAGLRRLRDLTIPRVELLKTPKGVTVEEAVVKLERDPRVRYAEPNHVLEATTTPDDAQFPNLWGQHNTGQTVNGDTGTADADIDAPEAWEQETGNSSVVVAVADTGIAFGHRDLTGNIWTNPGEVADNGVDDDGNGFVDDINGYDFIDNDGDASDDDGHGSHVAGTIGAIGNDGFGVNGVAWDVSLMGVRVLNSVGFGTSEQVAEGFHYAGEQGADIVNGSLAGSFDTLPATVKAAIDAHPDTLYVAAAGNSASDNETSPQWPCDLDSPNILCVAATDNDDQLASFSNYGSTGVDMGAPGVSILSTVPIVAPIHEAYGYEESLEGWTTGGTSDWGYTTLSPSWRAGQYSLTDSPNEADNDAYGANADTWAQSPQLNLAGRDACRLNYIAYLNLETDKDFLKVEYSRDGTNWTLAAEYTGWWEHWYIFKEMIDGADGDESVWVRFRLVSDGETQWDGVHIDNVQVECDPGDSYAYNSGTSMAAPHVAGAAAILYSANPTASVAQVKAALMNEGDPLTALEGKTVSGKRLNLKGSLDAITPPTPNPKSDGHIKRSGNAFRWKGLNVYTMGAGQMWKIAGQRGTSRTFDVRAQNDGDTTDAFAIVGMQRAGFSTKYFRGATNITTQVLNGTYVTPNLTPGKAHKITMKLKPGKRAKEGKTHAWKIHAISQASVAGGADVRDVVGVKYLVKH